MNEKFCVFIRISPKFDPKGLINSKSALVQVIAWRPTGGIIWTKALLGKQHKMLPLNVRGQQ